MSEKSLKSVLLLDDAYVEQATLVAEAFGLELVDWDGNAENLPEGVSYVIIAHLDNFQELELKFKSQNLDIKFLNIGQLDDLQSFVEHSGMMLLDPSHVENPVLSNWVQRVLRGSGVLTLPDLIGEETDVHRCKISDEFSAGYDTDFIAQHALKNSVDGIAVRNHVLSLFYYAAYLQRIQVSFFPLEIEYLATDKGMFLQCRFKSSKYVRDYLWRALGELGPNDPINHLLSLARTQTNFMEISVLESPCTVVINSFWYKDGSAKSMETAGLIVHSIPSMEEVRVDVQNMVEKIDHLEEKMTTIDLPGNGAQRIEEEEQRPVVGEQDMEILLKQAITKDGPGKLVAEFARTLPDGSPAPSEEEILSYLKNSKVQKQIEELEAGYSAFHKEHVESEVGAEEFLAAIKESALGQGMDEGQAEELVAKLKEDNDFLKKVESGEIDDDYWKMLSEDSGFTPEDAADVVSKAKQRMQDHTVAKYLETQKDKISQEIEVVEQGQKAEVLEQRKLQSGSELSEEELQGLSEKEAQLMKKLASSKMEVQELTRHNQDLSAKLQGIDKTSKNQQDVQSEVEQGGDLEQVVEGKLGEINEDLARRDLVIRKQQELLDKVKQVKDEQIRQLSSRIDNILNKDHLGKSSKDGRIQKLEQDVAKWKERANANLQEQLPDKGEQSIDSSTQKDLIAMRLEQAKLEQAQAASAQEREAERESQRNSLKDDVETKAQIDELNRQVKAGQLKIDTLNTKIDQINADHNKVQERLSNEMTLKAESAQKIRDLESALKAASDAAKKAEKQVLAQSAEGGGKAMSVEALHKANTEFKIKVNNLEKKVKTLETQLDRAKSAENNKSQQIAGKVQQLDRINKKVSGELAEQKKLVGQKQNEIAKIKSEKSALEHQVKKLEKELASKGKRAA